jgi:hypothetical protein
MCIDKNKEESCLLNVIGKSGEKLTKCHVKITGGVEVTKRGCGNNNFLNLLSNREN